MELKFIGERFSTVGTIITPSGKLRAKRGKNVPKLVKIAGKFLYIFPIYSPKIFDGGGLGVMAPVPPVYAPVHQECTCGAPFVTICKRATSNNYISYLDARTSLMSALVTVNPADQSTTFQLHSYFTIQIVTETLLIADSGKPLLRQFR